MSEPSEMKPNLVD